MKTEAGVYRNRTSAESPRKTAVRNPGSAKSGARTERPRTREPHCRVAEPATTAEGRDSGAHRELHTRRPFRRVGRPQCPAAAGGSAHVVVDNEVVYG